VLIFLSLSESRSNLAHGIPGAIKASTSTRDQKGFHERAMFLFPDHDIPPSEWLTYLPPAATLFIALTTLSRLSLLCSCRPGLERSAPYCSSMHTENQDGSGRICFNSSELPPLRSLTKYEDSHVPSCQRQRERFPVACWLRESATLGLLIIVLETSRTISWLK